MNLPKYTLERLVAVEQYLLHLQQIDINKVSSEAIGKHLGESAFTIRKDLNYLGAYGTKGSGYAVGKLLKIVQEQMFDQEQSNACIIGLGKLGALLLQMHQELFTWPIQLVAGFDININKIETLPTSIALHPFYELDEIVQRKNISIAILAVNEASLAEVVEKTAKTEINCVINYTNAPINRASIKNKIVHEINLNKELRYILAKSKQNNF